MQVPKQTASGLVQKAKPSRKYSKNLPQGHINDYDLSTERLIHIKYYNSFLNIRFGMIQYVMDDYIFKGLKLNCLWKSVSGVQTPKFSLTLTTSYAAVSRQRNFSCYWFAKSVGLSSDCNCCSRFLEQFSLVAQQVQAVVFRKRGEIGHWNWR